MEKQTNYNYDQTPSQAYYVATADDDRQQSFQLQNSFKEVDQNYKSIITRIQKDA